MQGAVRTTQDVSTRRNGHALAGCFAGFFIAGPAGERFGGRRVLLASAVLFARDCVHSSRNLRRWNNTDVRAFRKIEEGRMSSYRLQTSYERGNRKIGRASCR